MGTSSPTSGRAVLVPLRSTPAWIMKCRTPNGSTRRMSKLLSPTPAWRSRPSIVLWSAATPRCSVLANSSVGTIPARLTRRRTAPLAELSAPRLSPPPNAGAIVVIGQSKYVDEACLGGGGSSKVIPLYTVPPIEGMQDVLRDLGSSATVTKVTVADDLSNLEEAQKRAKEADVVVLMAGLIATEGADQPDANMLNDQNRMLDELLGINTTTVV